MIRSFWFVLGLDPREPRIIFAKNRLEGTVATLDLRRRLIDYCADGCLRRITLQVRPTSLLWHPEYTRSAIHRDAQTLTSLAGTPV
jgi:hypothetical protein